MSRALPPLILMQTIEAVTRLCSLKRAAEEMNVTPSAISHRIRLVEEQFGQRLFEREGQGIRPTEAALVLAAVVGDAVEEMQNSWRELTADAASQTVQLCAMSAFADQFLFANIDEFRRRFPEFQIHSTSMTVGEGGMRGDYDILIGIGPYPDESWYYEDLAAFTVRPIYAPGAGPEMTADGRLSGTFLVSNTGYMPWPEALQQLGYRLADGVRILCFDSVLTICQAAVDGKGTALAPIWMAEQLIASGRVEALGDAPIFSHLKYWTAVKKSRKLDSIYGRFRRWIEVAVANQAAHSYPSAG